MFRASLLLRPPWLLKAKHKLLIVHIISSGHPLTMTKEKKILVIESWLKKQRELRFTGYIFLIINYDKFIIERVCFTVKICDNCDLQLTVFVYMISHKMYLHLTYDALATQTLNFVLAQISLTAALHHK